MPLPRPRQEVVWLEMGANAGMARQMCKKRPVSPFIYLLPASLESHVRQTLSFHQNISSLVRKHHSITSALRVFARRLVRRPLLDFQIRLARSYYDGSYT